MTVGKPAWLLPIFLGMSSVASGSVETPSAASSLCDPVRVTTQAPGEAFRVEGPPVALGEALYYIAIRDSPSWKMGLWKVDGTPLGTRALFEEQTLRRLGNLTVAGGALFFTVDHLQTGERFLWTSDGSENGTRQLINLSRDEVHLPEWRGGVAVGGALVFATHDSTHGSTLWRSDGSPEGTSILWQLPTGAEVKSMAGLNGRALFVVENPDKWSDLWSGDGTQAGSVVLAHTHTPEFIARTQGFQYLTQSGTNQHMLQTDGTPEGTRTVEQPFMFQSVALHHHTISVPHVAAAMGRLFYVERYTLWSNSNDPSGPSTYTLYEADPTTGTPRAEAWGATRGLASLDDRYILSADLHALHWNHVPDSARGVISFPELIRPRCVTGLGDWVYFVADDDIGGPSIVSSPLYAFPKVCLEDHAAPALQCPGNVMASTDSTAGTAVSYASITATDDQDAAPDIQVSGVPEGGVFPPGVTVVTATATDDVGHASTCSFEVEVRKKSVPTQPGSPPSTGCGATTPSLTLLWSTLLLLVPALSRRRRS